MPSRAGIKENALSIHKTFSDTLQDMDCAYMNKAELEAKVESLFQAVMALLFPFPPPHVS